MLVVGKLELKSISIAVFLLVKEIREIGERRNCWGRREGRRRVETFDCSTENITFIPNSFLCFLTKELTSCRSSRSSCTSETELDLAPISFWRDKHICDKT